MLALAASHPLEAQPAPGRQPSRAEAAALKPLEVPSWAQPSSPAEIALGGRLFTDTRLSRSGKIACSSCHDLTAAGADSYAINPMADSARPRRNVPTVFNASLNPTLGWDGAFDSLEAEAAASMESPEMMNAEWGPVLAALADDPGYREGFAAAYGTPPSREGIISALAAFERTLLTPGSRFDRYLAGDDTALTAAEIAGYELFQRIGCVSCHQGRNVGGNLFARFGVFESPAGQHADDPGRQAVTGRDTDRHVFRVPSLRNVAVTPPYFQDGSAATLAHAVAVMAKSQLGRPLEPRDVDLIVQFLGTLTGSYDGHELAPSATPPR